MKIAVLRANALGDFIFALPALEALRAAQPKAEIVLLARAWHAEFLASRPCPVDRIICVPGDGRAETSGAGRFADAPWLAASRDERARFREAMRAEAFDIAIQLHGGGGNSNPFLAELGASLTIGLRSPVAAPLDRWVPFVYYQQEVARCLEVMALLDVAPVTLEPRLELIDSDVERARTALPTDDPRPILVMHPGAVDPRRRWPAERFAAVGDALAAEGLRVVVTGTDAERELVGSVVESMRHPAVNLAGRTSLSALAGIMGRARLVISNDSGPLHLAFAIGADTVGIYWCGNLINGGPMTRRGHRPMISWRLNCPTCGQDCTRGSCPHDASFVADVTEEEVLEAAKSLLAPPAGAVGGPPPVEADAVPMARHVQVVG
jgi:ADP-heptose:LPS heptosyltransferase